MISTAIKNSLSLSLIELLIDITQSGVNDQMITLTTSGDNADIDISQTD